MTNKQENRKNKKAAVFIDAANYHYFLAKEGWEIDWKKFMGYFNLKYESILWFYYEGTPSKAVVFDHKPNAKLSDFIETKNSKKRYFKFLKSLGMVVRTKLVGRVYDSTEGRYKHKCNFDVELTIDAIDNLGKYDDFILCSGDGDFVRLIKYLKGKFKKTVVIAPSKHFSASLWKASNQAVCLEDIKEKIVRIK